jgi:hypothetical protein
VLFLKERFSTFKMKVIRLSILLVLPSCELVKGVLHSVVSRHCKINTELKLFYNSMGGIFPFFLSFLEIC